MSRTTSSPSIRRRRCLCCNYRVTCAKLLEDTNRVCVMYDILKQRGLDSEARWQGLHALKHIKAMISRLERLSFNQVLRRVAAKEKETDNARFGQ